MPDIGLDRTNAASAHGVSGFPVGLRECGYFDGIAQKSSRAMALDIGHAFSIHPRHGVCFCNTACLPIYRRGQIACLCSSIVIDCRALDDRPDMVAVT